MVRFGLQKMVATFVLCALTGAVSAIAHPEREGAPEGCIDLPDLSSSLDVPRLVYLLGDSCWPTAEAAQMRLVSLLEEADRQSSDPERFINSAVTQSFLATIRTQLLQIHGNTDRLERARKIATSESYSFQFIDWALHEFAAFPNAEQSYAVGRALLDTGENERAAFDLATAGLQLVTSLNRHFSTPDRSLLRHADLYLPPFGFELTDQHERWADLALRNIATGILYALTTYTELKEVSGELEQSHRYSLSLLIGGEYSIQSLLSRDLATIALLFGNLTPEAFSAPPLTRDVRVHLTDLPVSEEPDAAPIFTVESRGSLAAVALGGSALNFDGDAIVPLRQQIHYDLADFLQEYRNNAVSTQIQFVSPAEF